MEETVPSGGNHGGGRPANIQRSIKANEQIARKLRDVVNVELGLAADNYADILKKAIELAKAGNVVLLKMFVELPFKSLDFTEVPDNNLDVVREMLSHMPAGEVPSGTNT